MKYHTSRFLRTIAYLHFAYPVLFLAYIAFAFHLSNERILRISGTWSFWGLSLLGILTGYGLREMTRWAWNAFVLSIFSTIYALGMIAYRYADIPQRGTAFTVSFICLVILLYWLGREIKVPYFLPQIRWWENNPRFKLVLPVRLKREHEFLDGEILDISLGGCFVKSRGEIQVNETVSVMFKLFEADFTFEGVVVWKSQQSVTHPKGFGVKFKKPVDEQAKLMNRACLHLKKMSKLQQKRDKLSPDEYQSKLNDLKKFSLLTS